MSEFTYAFITSEFKGSRFVKFGVSCDPIARRWAVSNGCPIAIQTMIVMVAPSLEFSRHAEAVLHSMFLDRHSSGEWFEFDAEDIERTVMAAMRKASAEAHFTGRPKVHPLKGEAVRLRVRQARQSTVRALKGRRRLRA